MPEQPPREPFDWFGRVKERTLDIVVTGRVEQRELREREEHEVAQAAARAALQSELDGAIRVTDVVGANTITFTYADGSEAAPPHQPTVEDGAAGITSHSLVDMLAGVYVRLGRHDHDAHNITDIFGLRYSNSVLARMRLEQALPPEVYARTRQDDTRWSRVANVLINSRLAKEEEAAAYQQRLKVHREAEYAQERAEVDGNKPNLLAHDYATITVGHQQYRVPLRSAEAVMACRVAEAIGGLGQEHVRTSTVTHTVWRLMHTAERGLLTDNRAYILGQGEHTATKRVMGTLNTLMGQLSIATRFSPGWFTVLAQPKVTYHEEPPPGQVDINVVFVFPQDTAVDTRREEAEEITDAHRMQARELLDSLAPGRREALGAQEAIRILNFLISRAGYWALHSELQRDQQFTDREGLEDAYRLTTDVIKNRIAYALGDGYSDAESGRYIRGYRGRGVRLVSRDLGDRTKWFVGIIPRVRQPD